MDLDKSSKQERNSSRRDKEILKQAKQSDFIRSLVTDMEDRPEEVTLIIYFGRGIITIT
jgi:U3 small nucleolar ribonucleoprotein protein LCP5